MGLLEQIAAAAIRNRMLAALRQRCPAPLRDALETLLADSAAVSALQQLATAAHAGKASVSAESILALPLPGASAELLRNTPDLLHFLAEAAAALQAR